MAAPDAAPDAARDAPSGAPAPELVTLLDEQGRPCGAAEKAAVHHRETPLHLAFSCWLIDERGRTLLTRRAAVKRTWPGAWTNSFCGHPAPGEPVLDALHRRGRGELGAEVADAVVVLPDFRYRAVMDDGTVENEVCPVYTARLASAVVPDPAEVDDLRWVDLRALRDEVERDPGTYSPWMRRQLDELHAGLLIG